MKTIYIIYTFTFFLYSTFSYSQAGSLDPTFSGDGNAGAPIFSGQRSQGYGIAVQEDSKILVSGSTRSTDGHDYAFLERYKEDGTLDNSFNGSGIIVAPVEGLPSYSQAVLSQPDGKIVMLAQSNNGQDVRSSLFRYNADGSPDNSFDTDGMAITSLGLNSLGVKTVILQPDGKILVGGYAGRLADTFDMFMVLRYLPNGKLDNSFDGDGIDTVRVGTNYTDIQSLILQLDGKIIAVGYATFDYSDDFTVVRYNSNGTLDYSFGDQGVAHARISDEEDRGIGGALQPDGKIVVGGYSLSNITGKYVYAAARFNGDGTLDNNFHGDGMTTIITTGYSDGPRSVLLQPDGKIVLGGYVHSDSTGGQDMALVRLNPNGIPDFTFDGDGVAVYRDNLDTSSELGSIVLQPDGKIVGTGYFRVGGLNVVRVSRFISGLTVSTKDEYMPVMDISLFPNPVSDKVNLVYSLDRNETISINLYDLQGRRVQQLMSPTERNTGQHSEQLSLHRPLPPGNYILNMESKNWNNSLKVVIN